MRIACDYQISSVQTKKSRQRVKQKVGDRQRCQWERLKRWTREAKSTDAVARLGLLHSVYWTAKK
jgi:hypothetical protein